MEGNGIKCMVFENMLHGGIELKPYLKAKRANDQNTVVLPQTLATCMHAGKWQGKSAGNHEELVGKFAARL